MGRIGKKLDFIIAFTCSSAIAPALFTICNQEFHLSHALSLAVALASPFAGIAVLQGHSMALARQVGIGRDTARKLDAIAFLPLLCILLAYLPFEFPQKFNHHLARLRTALALSIFLIIQIKGWTLVFLTRQNRMQNPMLVTFVFFFTVFAAYGLITQKNKMWDDDIGYFHVMRSIAEDGDLNLANNMYPEFIAMHPYLFEKYKDFDLFTDEGRLIYNHVYFHNGTTYHDEKGWHMFFPSMPLIPAVWAIPYRIGGATAVAFFQIMVGALLFTLLMGVCRRMGLAFSPSFAALLLIGMLPHIVGYVQTYLIEIPAAALLASIVFLLHGTSFRSKFGAAFMTGLLPWAHIRLAPLAAGLVLALFFLRQNTFREKMLLAALACLMTAATIPFNLHVYKNIVPWGFRPQIQAETIQDQIKHGAYEESAIREHFALGLTPIGKGMIRKNRLREGLGALIGEREGLFSLYPLLFLAIFGCVRFSFPVAVPAIAYLLFLVVTPYPAHYFRYCIPIIPILAIGLASQAATQQRCSVVFTATGLFALGLSAIGFVFPGTPLDSIVKHMPFALSDTGPCSGSDLLVALEWLALTALLVSKQYLTRPFVRYI